MKGLKQCLKLGIIGICLCLIFPSSFIISEESKDVISYTQFLAEVEKGKVKEIKVFWKEKIEGKYNDGIKFTTNIPYYDENLIKILRKNKVVVWYGEYPPKKEIPFWITMNLTLFFVGIGMGLFFIFLCWISYKKRWGLSKIETLYWEKMPEHLNEIIKRCDSIIELLKNKQ